METPFDEAGNLFFILWKNRGKIRKVNFEKLAVCVIYRTEISSL